MFISPHLLVSSSLDGTIILYDIRTSNRSQITLLSSNSAIRDISYNHHFTESHYIAAAHENGNISLFDIRNTSTIDNSVYNQQSHYLHQSHHTHHNNVNSHSMYQFPSHQSICSSVDFHPTERILLSGGNDKLIKVWDISSSTIKPLFSSISSISSIGLVRWRPHCQYQFAVSSTERGSNSDNTLKLYDTQIVNRNISNCSYHNDLVSDFSFVDTNAIVSCGRDGVIQLTSAEIWKNGNETLKTALNTFDPLTGDLSTVFEKVNDRYGTMKMDIPQMQTQSKYVQNYRLHSVDTCISIHPNYSLTSNICHPSLSNDQRSEIQSIKICAVEYILNASSVNVTLSELCSHNATVAEECGRSDVSRVWRVIAKLYSNEFRDDHREQFNDQHENDTYVESDVENRHKHYPLPYSRQIAKMKLNHLTILNNLTVDISAPNLSKRKLIYQRQIEQKHSFRLQIISSALKQFVDCRSDVQTAVSVTLVILQYFPNEFIIDDQILKQWCLAYIQLLQRLNLLTSAIEIMHLSPSNDIRQLNSSTSQFDISCSNCKNAIIPSQQPSKSLLSSQSTSPTSLSISKSSLLLSSNILTDNYSLNIIQQCSECHSNSLFKCSVCHLSVSGLYFWCQICQHGGHLSHMRKWFETEQYCPTGCMHQCWNE